MTRIPFRANVSVLKGKSGAYLVPGVNDCALNTALEVIKGR